MRLMGALILVSIACGGGSAGTDGGSNGNAGATAVKDEGFSRTCSTDDDCVVVHFGDTCGICRSSNAAIAKSAQASYQQAYNTAQGHCPPVRAVGKCAARYGVSRCTEQKCTFIDCDSTAPADEHHCRADGGR